MPLMRQAVVSLAAVALVACSDPTGPVRRSIDELPRPLTDSERSLIEASNGFAFSLLRQVNAEAPDSNLFLSPLSVSMALGMAMNGTAGETQQEIREALGFGNMPLADANQSYRSLIDMLRGLDDRVDFRLANSIWYEQTFPVEPGFLEITTDYFDAEVAAVDFRDPGTVDEINAWVDDATAGKIERILDVIPGDAVMYLINAIYFKGDWTTTFEAKNTHDAPFAALGGQVTVPMMQKDDSIAYANVNGTQIIELPYGGEAFAMSVVLPPPGTDINTFIANLTPQQWDALHGAMRGHNVRLYFPKFKLESEVQLKNALRALGINLAFSGGLGDFSPMSSTMGDRLEISRVKHKTYVDVDERGTEAAAVTAVEVVAVCACGPQLVEFRADRPFVFAIRERLTGTILFVGKVVSL